MDFIDFDSSKKKCMGFSKKQTYCKNIAIHKSDFCYIHNKKKIYNIDILDKIKNVYKSELKLNDSDIMCLKEHVAIKYMLKRLNERIKRDTKNLNDNYLHGLMGVDEWDNIPFIYWILINNIWWDVRLIARHISSQLNCTEMENPLPVFPSDPYTRQLFSIVDLMSIKNKLINLNIQMNMALFEFLNIDPNILEKIRSINDTYRLIEIFCETMRFQLTNFKNSQECYCGRWVDKSTPFSKFEMVYDKYKKLSSQTIGTDELGTIYIVHDQTSIYYKILLDSLPVDNSKYF